MTFYLRTKIDGIFRLLTIGENETLKSKDIIERGKYNLLEKYEKK